MLGALLAAQAAIAALSLAVVLFALERVSARPDADDRIFEEYARRSRMWPIFLGGLGAVAVTGLVLLAGEFASGGVPIAQATPGLRNLVFAAAGAFVASVVLPAVLLERATRLARPGAWRDLRREVNEQNVRDAVLAFIARQARLERGELRDGEDPFFTQMIPDPGEGSADEAIRRLLEDASRAIDERRDADFRRSLDSMEQLVEHAMDKLREHGWQWEEPGSEAKWPPLAELHRNLYRLRRAVIVRGDQEHAYELAAFDMRLARAGVERGCGELFTVALSGCRANYTFASEARNQEFRQLFRDAVWSHVRYVFLAESADELPYLREAARHQAVLLFRAVQGGHVDDFREFRRQFHEMLSSVRDVERMHSRHRRQAQHEHGGDQELEAPLDDDPLEASWVDQAQQDGRVALMEVGGIAIHLAESDGLPDAQPYLDVVRSEYQGANHLARDMVRAIDVHESDRYFWTDLLDSTVAIDWTPSNSINPVLPFFAVRLLELSHNPMPDLDLRGNARPLLQWFSANAGAVEPYLRPETEIPIEQRRALVLEGLEAAVRKDDEPRGTESERS